MTQEEKIREIIKEANVQIRASTPFPKSVTDIVMDNAVQDIKDLFTTELNRRMEEVIDKAFEDHFKMAKQAYETGKAGGLVLLDEKEVAAFHAETRIYNNLKSLLNDRNEDDSKKNYEQP